MKDLQLGRATVEIPCTDPIKEAQFDNANSGPACVRVILGEAVPNQMLTAPRVPISVADP